MMENTQLKIEYWAIDRLIPYARNPRKNDHAVDQAASWIREFGFRVPVLAKSNGDLIDGHLRLKAARKLGMEKVPVCLADDMTDTQIKAFRLSVNKMSELADWDDDLLKLELEDLDNLQYDIGSLHFDDIKIDTSETKNGLTDDDEIPEVEKNVYGVQKGDIWILGNHRLMCGDSTNQHDVEKLMNGQKADITFTSPPYNVGKTTRGNLYQNDSDKKSDYIKFLSDCLNISLNQSIYSFFNLQLLSNNWFDILSWQSLFTSKIKDIFVWNKKQCPPNIQKGSFNTKFELVYCFTNEKITGRNFPCSWQGKYSNVVETESNSNNEFSSQHKAGFPVSFPLWFIEKLDFVKSIYEPFCGTGTTIIACEKTGCICYGMEIDPQYCSLIIKRWEDFTGQKAIKTKGEI